jgi:hypothetical protein
MAEGRQGDGRRVKKVDFSSKKVDFFVKN